jgi:hypothetical protein
MKEIRCGRREETMPTLSVWRREMFGIFIMIHSGGPHSVRKGIQILCLFAVSIKHLVQD